MSKTEEGLGESDAEENNIQRWCAASLLILHRLFQWNNLLNYLISGLLCLSCPPPLPIKQQCPHQPSNNKNCNSSTVH